MGTISYIVKYLIPIIAVVVILIALFSSPGAFFSKIKSITKTIAPNITIGAEKAKPMEVTAAPDAQAAYNNLKDIFTKWVEQPDERCLIPYNEFGSNWGNDVLKLEYLDEYGLRFVVIHREKDKPEYELLASTLPGPNLVPCIIAGNKTVVENFWNNWIEKKTPIKLPEYTGWYGLEITGKYTLVADKEYDLEDEGLSKDGKEISLLYKADSNHICFFTTFNWGIFTKYNEDGIEDGYTHLLNSKYGVPYCAEYPPTTLQLGRFVIYNIARDISFATNVTLTFYNSSEANTSITSDNFYSAIRQYISQYTYSVDQTDLARLDTKDMGNTLKKWLNDYLKKRWIIEVNLHDINITSYTYTTLMTYIDLVDSEYYASNYPEDIMILKQGIKEICEVTVNKITNEANRRMIMDKCATLDKAKYYPPAT